MAGLGVMEVVGFLAVVFGSGGVLGLPLSVPPLPPDAVIERAAPDACLFHLETAGVAAPQADAQNLTERMLANEDVRAFIEGLAGELVAAARQSAAAPPQVTDAMAVLVEAALTQPMAVSVERVRLPSANAPPGAVASFVLRTGKKTAEIDQALATMMEIVFAGAPRPQTVRVAGAAWQQMPSPMGPLSWGVNDGSLVVAFGDTALEGLLARLADTDRPTPAWKQAIGERVPVDRRSTLTYLNVGEMLEMLVGLEMPDRDQAIRFLKATGIAGLDTVAAVSGLSPEGVTSTIWLGFDGRPQGLFAAPAKGIGSAALASIPADAMMAQTWSLDLSQTLATALDIADATEPAAAESAREALMQFRAVVGLDIDTHILKPLGPDWTVMSLPAPGGMLPNVAVIAGVRDRETFAQVHKALIGILKNATAEADVKLSVREIPYRDQTLFCLEAAGPEFALPVTPTWCLTDDQLIITISPQLIRTLLAREPAAGGIGTLPEVQQAVGSGEPALVGVVDPVWLLGSVFSFYEMGAPVARGVLREQGLEIDLPQLPPSSSIMPFARPSVSVVRHEADGILVTSTGTMPLGPLTSGGGVLGVSPASTPVLVGLLLPAVQAAREAARRTQMTNNFKQVMLAMHNYAAAWRRLPSQAICDEEGKPLLSWRVALLPYLEEGNLYAEFRLDEPWDSEHNKKLIARMPAVYADPSAPPERAAAGLTTIQVISGEKTAFVKPGEGPRFGAITDGTSNTLAVVEAVPDRAVPWTKPDDIPFDPKRPLAGVGNPQRPGGVFIVGMFDGSVRTLTPNLDPDVFKRLVTPDGGEVVDPNFDLE